MNDTIESVQL